MKVLILVAALTATPDKPPELRWTCWSVRRAVAIYGEEDLIGMARRAGVSEAEITRARRCLRPKD